MILAVKALLGAAVVLIISLLSQSRNYYIAGLLPLFPTFALITHYTVGTGRTVENLRETIVFGMWSIIPYFFYLSSMYILVVRVSLLSAMVCSTMIWSVAAIALIFMWNNLR